MYYLRFYTLISRDFAQYLKIGHKDTAFFWNTQVFAQYFL